MYAFLEHIFVLIWKVGPLCWDIEIGPFRKHCSFLIAIRGLETRDNQSLALFTSFQAFHNIESKSGIHFVDSLGRFWMYSCSNYCSKDFCLDVLGNSIMFSCQKFVI